MGNETSTTVLKIGDNVKIKQSKFTIKNEISNDILKTQHIAKVIDIKKLYKSRQNFPDITVCKIRFQDGRSDVYSIDNLTKI